MKGLLKYFINNSVATNLIMMAILIIGLFTLYSVRIEAFPKVPASTITITGLYTGASAKQIDELITQKIEQKLEGIAGIKKVYSTSEDDIATIMVEKKFSTDIHRLKESIRNKLDEVYDFPKKMQKLVFSIDDYSMSAMYITLSGKADIKTLEHFGSKIRKTLLRLPEISKIDTWGNTSPQIDISFNPTTLKKYDISLDEIIATLENRLHKEVDGKLTKDGKVISLSVNDEVGNVEGLKEIPLYITESGTKILLSDLATIRDSFEEDYIVPRFDNERAYGMEIKITGHENVIEIAEVLKKNIAVINETLPENLILTSWGDSSSYISNRLSLLNDNALQGILIVFILLALFLNVKLAFWVAMGIPISLAGSIAILGSSFLDYSINDITTLGMILSLGLLVDDAIVIGESIFTERKKTKDRKFASIKGVEKVATATIFGALTTIAAFIPMFLIQDELIKILASFSIVIMITLAVSMFESKFLLPAHISHIEDEKKESTLWLVRLWKFMQQRAQNALRYVNYKLYAPTLSFSIKHRYAVLLVMVSIATVGFSMMLNGSVKTVFYPEIPAQSIQIKLDMDSKAQSTLTNTHAKHIEDVVEKLNQQLLNSYHLSTNPLKHTFMQIEALHVETYIELSASEYRKRVDTLFILDELKKEIGDLEAVHTLEFSATDSFAGKFALNIYSEDREVLSKASKELRTHLERINGVSEVDNSISDARSKLHVELKPIAYQLGFDEEMFSKQMSLYFSNTEIATIVQNTKKSKIVVKQYNRYKDSIYDVLNIELKNREGEWYPLSSIANVTSSFTPKKIDKENSKGVSTITAHVDKSIISPLKLQEELTRTIILDLQQRYPQVTFDEAGELESIGLAKSKLSTTLIITMLLIYILLALPLKSYIQPFIIMSVIPFAFIGAMLGHILEGFSLSVFSFLGILALIGIVVNDSLVLMSVFNEKRAEGMSVQKALQHSGVSRFRAIFLTTVTTVSGLMPLINETSENAQYLIPSAISIAYGEIFATLLTLILIPIVIAIVEDFKRLTDSKCSNKIKDVV